MMRSVTDPLLQQTIDSCKTAFKMGITKTRQVNGTGVTVSYPFPSPTDWRDVWIYFLMIDRFNNPNANPVFPWNQQYNFRQGGKFKGIEAQLDYIAGLGAKAIWISPVLKNAKPEWDFGYPGYATQDFLSIDGRFASDGQDATAEKELIDLIEASHARGLYIIVDIVINHTARVFDYVMEGITVDAFTNSAILNGPLGDEPPVQWMNGFGFPRSDWQDAIPKGTNLSTDDAIYPEDLRTNTDFFRRRGSTLADHPEPGSFIKGDFGSMRQLTMEYLATVQNKPELRKQYGIYPVVNILVKAYSYLIAKFDIDGFRIDTVKYVDPDMIQNFGNAIREFCLSIGKKNFFTFGEIYDDEATINEFVGRNSSTTEGFGIDAALDFPLFYQLPNVIKGFADVSALRSVFADRKTAEQHVLSSHGEAGKYFVTFLDNHDQNQRFNYPGVPAMQLTAALAVLFCLQGIPCLYYGTEQGLDGTKTLDGRPSIGTKEAVREALWGKQLPAFDTNNEIYLAIQRLAQLRTSEASLLYGRLYFREVSGNGIDFGLPSGIGSLIAFSRILYDTEVLVVANTSSTTMFTGFVLVDYDINQQKPTFTVVFSNAMTTGKGVVQIISQANFYEGPQITGSGPAAALFVILKPAEVQVLAWE